MSEKELDRCRWTSFRDALRYFNEFAGKTESAAHIKPLHWAIACRLVVEGGFDPDSVIPRPPFRVERRRGAAPTLIFDPSVGGAGEQTVLGGLKTKKVDVVVSLERMGPVLAVSCKGVTGAFRNLTNRMEETIGECTNLHITYPALVFGYAVILRGNRRVDAAIHVGQAVVGEQPPILKELKANDIAIEAGGQPVASIVRFKNALAQMAGRAGVRNDVSRYEAICLMLGDVADSGHLNAEFPSVASGLRVEEFFRQLYLRYDERFVIAAPDIVSKTKRSEWDPYSPAFGLLELDYPPRIASESKADEREDLL